MKPDFKVTDKGIEVEYEQFGPGSGMLDRIIIPKEILIEAYTKFIDGYVHEHRDSIVQKH